MCVCVCMYVDLAPACCQFHVVHMVHVRFCRDYHVFVCVRVYMCVYMCSNSRLWMNCSCCVIKKKIENKKWLHDNKEHLLTLNPFLTCSCFILNREKHTFFFLIKLGWMNLELFYLLHFFLQCCKSWWRIFWRLIKSRWMVKQCTIYTINASYARYAKYFDASHAFNSISFHTRLTKNTNARRGCWCSEWGTYNFDRGRRSTYRTYGCRWWRWGWQIEVY